MEIRRNVDSSEKARTIAKAYDANVSGPDTTLITCVCGVDIDSEYYDKCGACGHETKRSNKMCLTCFGDKVYQDDEIPDQWYSCYACDGTGFQLKDGIIE